MLPPIRPALDPFAQRAAIDALEAQRAAYQHYARTVDDQSRSVGGGDADGAVAAAGMVARGYDELDAGALALRPHLDRVRTEGTPAQQAEVQRHIENLTDDAERAQAAIQNLTSQLDAWRVAYGRQLASVGLAPGSAGGAGGRGGDSLDGVGGVGSPELVRAAGASGDSRGHDVRGYGPRGQPAASQRIPTLLNRLG